MLLCSALPGLLFSVLPKAVHAQPHPARICPTAPSTIAIDLGYYRGAWLVSRADGSLLEHAGWQSCPPQSPKGNQKPWESCNFSLCDLEDGVYLLRFADPPAPAALTLRVHNGLLDMVPAKLAVQVGNFGVDATGGAKRIGFDLQGYALDWSIAHWPGPFLGGETHGRGVHYAGKLVFGLYPSGPYRLTVAGAAAELTVAEGGTVTATPANGPLSAAGNVVTLRAAPVAITPPDAGQWFINGIAYEGPQTLMLPAGGSFALGRQTGATQVLKLDPACHPAIADGAFKAALAADANLGKTCP
jgi:hypothetical protein